MPRALLLCAVAGCFLTGCRVPRSGAGEPGGLATIPSSGRSYDAKPLPTGADAPLAAVLDPVREGLWQRLILDAYKEHAVKADAPASSAADQVALNAFYRWLTKGELPDPEVFEKQTVAASEDPLVQHAIGAVMVAAGRRGERWLKKALAGYPTSEYDLLLAAEVPLLMGWFGDPRDKATPAYQDAIVAGFEGFLPQAQEQRVVWQHWRSLLGKNHVAMSNLAERLKDSSTADPWLRQVVVGAKHLDTAWSIRGTGWAKDVQPENWEPFRRHMTEADKALRAAHALHPDWPETACELIGVAMTGHDAMPPRYWFDQCVAAALDWDSAYEAMVISLLPRWGGSHDAMLAFGSECLATQRWDTNLPGKYYLAVLWIARADEVPDIWIRTDVRRTLEQFSNDALAHDWRAGYQYTLQAALAYQAGEYQEARRKLDAIDANYDPEPLTDMALDPVGTVADIYLRTSQYAETWQRIDDALAGRRFAEAKRLLQTMKARQLPAPEEYVRGERLKEAELQLALLSGDWVDITPDSRLWETEQGTWRAAKPGGVATTVIPPGEWWSRLRSKPRWRFPLRIRGRYRVGPATASHYSVGLSLASYDPVTHQLGEAEDVAGGFTLKPGQVYLHRADDRPADAVACTTVGRHDFELWLGADGGSAVWLDGKLIDRQSAETTQPVEAEPFLVWSLFDQDDPMAELTIESMEIRLGGTEQVPGS